MFPAVFRKFIGMVLLAGMVLVSGCRESANPKADLPAVVAEPAEEMDFADYIMEIGEVDAYDTVELVANVSGFLTEANFKEGMLVKKGTLLFQIDPSVYQAAVNKAEADLNKAHAEAQNAEIEFNRQKTMLASNATAKRNYDNAEMVIRTAKAAVKSAEAILAQKKVDLGYTRILAPFDGWIGFKTYSVGNMVGPTSGSLARITRSGNVKVYFSVDELSLLKLLRAYPHIEKENREHPHPEEHTSKTGPDVDIYFQDGVKYKYKAWISAWNNMVRDGTFRLQATCENPDGVLLPGMYVKVKVQLGAPEKRIMIREEAIMREQLGNFIYVVGKGNKIERRKIQLGSHSGDWYVIKGGLKKGELVVTSGLQKAIPGREVKVVTARDAIPGVGPAEKETVVPDKGKKSDSAANSKPAPPKK